MKTREFNFLYVSFQGKVMSENVVVTEIQETIAVRGGYVLEKFRKQ